MSEYQISARQTPRNTSHSSHTKESDPDLNVRNSAMDQALQAKRPSTWSSSRSLTKDQNDESDGKILQSQTLKDPKILRLGAESEPLGNSGNHRKESVHSQSSDLGGWALEEYDKRKRLLDSEDSLLENDVLGGKEPVLPKIVVETAPAAENGGSDR